METAGICLTDLLIRDIHACMQLPSNHSFDGPISAHRKGDGVRGGWGNGSDRQLQTSLLQHLHWGPLDHASCRPQLRCLQHNYYSCM